MTTCAKCNTEIDPKGKYWQDTPVGDLCDPCHKEWAKEPLDPELSGALKETIEDYDEALRDMHDHNFESCRCPECNLEVERCAICGASLGEILTDAGIDPEAAFERLLDRLDKEGLAYGKYSRWAKDLSPDQLSGLLWLVGEFSLRASVNEVPAPEDADSLPEARKRAALRAVIGFRHSPITVDDWRRQLHEIKLSKMG